MRSTAFAILGMALIWSMQASAQRRPTGSQEKKVGVAIDLRVSGAAYTFKGEATCDHLAKGSIYDVVAERWSVRQNDGDRSLNFSLWRPTGGTADMVTLNVSMGGKRFDVSTVKSPQGASGSGSVKLAPQGAGGTFTIDATTASAARITGTVKCDAFTAAETVAGD